MLKTYSANQAVVMPVVPLGGKPWRGKGGVFDSNGVYLDSSMLERNWGKIITEPEFRNPVQYLPGTNIFGGYNFFGHYGHFLLESCSRLWFAKEHPEIPILWVLGHSLSEFQIEILEILGLQNRHIFIFEPTRVEHLSIPEPGYRIQDQFCGVHKNFLAAWEHFGNEQNKRVWLSRTGLAKNKGRVLNEPLIEQRLKVEGWKIFQPECHTVSEQLKVLSGAKHLAGFMGSAFHSLILLKRPPERITIFSRGMENRNYSTIALAKNLNQEIITLPLKFGSNKGASTISSVQNLAIILDTLGVEKNSPVWRTQSGQASQVVERQLTRQIKYLLTKLNGSRFLDLGTAHKNVFLAQTIGTKVAVSPAFDFDYRPHINAVNEFYELPTIDYFTFHAKRRVFDVILVSRVCSFADSFREFCCSISHSSAKTVWVINHSCSVDPDMNLSYPNRKDAEDLVTESEQLSRSWSFEGEKLIFAINDFFPNMSLITVSSTEGFQSFIWNEPRTEFEPYFDSLQSISKLSLLEVQANLKKLLQLGEARALERVVTGVEAAVSELDGA